MHPDDEINKQLAGQYASSSGDLLPLRQYAPWWRTSLGQQILQYQSQYLASYLHKGRYGEQLLCMSACYEQAWLPANCYHTLYWQPSWQPDMAGKPQTALICQPHQMPLPEHSMDQLVLHHMLEVCTSPQAVLAEAVRVVRPSGYIWILGFCPFSILGGLARAKSKQMSPWSSTTWRTPQAVVNQLQAAHLSVYRIHKLPNKLKDSGVGWRGTYVIQAQIQPLQPKSSHKTAWQWPFVPSSATSLANIKNPSTHITKE
ncbi:Methyltransferase domain-containing protein [Allopseudospirillum japonicum]|uniref:Methyltransferase domain-containing protein n=1 Tax=Allopseudospirillum japonicum TaxID=64971 RepID=A0A1H6SBQ6_9GAMM|nr:methyltransferase domain-containing protein [Allopseudospirillum japonicum]SEI61450.1 Methyltransferase domain-containing protein [Allopseudospirillum japonicum]